MRCKILYDPCNYLELLSTCVKLLNLSKIDNLKIIDNPTTTEIKKSNILEIIFIDGDKKYLKEVLTEMEINPIETINNIKKPSKRTIIQVKLHNYPL
jgi:hypothetical protein